MISESPDSHLKAFELPSSAWELILSICPAREVGEVRKALGDSLVEQTCDLHEEASTLHEIWQQVRQDSDIKLAQIEASRRSLTSPSLPEPPAVRERLIQEIQFFVGYLKQKLDDKGDTVGGRLLSSPDNKEIFDYITHNSSSKGERGLISRGSSASGSTCSRPMSAVSSRDGRETPLRVHTPTSASEDGSQILLLSDRVEAVNQQVNAFDIDAVVKHLRQVLEDECEQLRQEIAFLQSCLDGEHDFMSTTLGEEIKPEPTLQELRAFGTKLEREVLETAAKQKSVRVPHSQTPPLKPSLLPSLTPRPPLTSSPNRRPLNRASKVKLKSTPLPQDTDSISSSSDSLTSLHTGDHKLHKSTTSNSVSAHKNDTVTAVTGTPFLLDTSTKNKGEQTHNINDVSTASASCVHNRYTSTTSPNCECNSHGEEMSPHLDSAYNSLTELHNRKNTSGCLSRPTNRSAGSNNRCKVTSSRTCTVVRTVPISSHLGNRQLVSDSRLSDSKQIT